jgi:inosine-uridine nucleoside N-ribohydrolase
VGARVIIDNDFAGDPDGLVQLAHHLLCPSVDVRAVIGSQVAWFDLAASDDAAERSADAARVVAELAGRPGISVLPGSNEPLGATDRPQRSDAVDAIVAEAMRDDTDLPLFVACGGGLTTIASAWLTEPRIASRLTVVWIGGNEHPGLAMPPPGALEVEYNASIDPRATRVAFNDSDLDLWQVPRDAYRRVLASWAELKVRVAPLGPLGAHLVSELERFATMLGSFGIGGDTVVLGDSALVLLTALCSPIDPDPSSSSSVAHPRPHIGPDGGYRGYRSGPDLRLFTSLDSRLVIEDLIARLALHAAG